MVWAVAARLVDRDHQVCEQGGRPDFAARAPVQLPPAPEAAGRRPQLWWRRCTQESLGRPFWQNVMTNETTWQAPSPPDIEVPNVEVPNVQVTVIEVPGIVAPQQNIQVTVIEVPGIEVPHEHIEGTGSERS